MPPASLAALLSGMLPLFSAAAGAMETDICPSVVIRGEKIEMTAVERRLVCGDPGSDAWKEVPRSQAIGFLKAFLQQRAYHSPVFKEEEGRLLAETGPMTRTRRLLGEGFPPGVDLGKFRGVVGAPLTPSLLDKVKGKLVSGLQNLGYACPEVLMSADAGSGEIRARFTGGAVRAADSIEDPKIEGVDPGIFRRFEAFKRDRPLDQRLLTLTSNRVVSEALFLTSSYDVTCSSSGVRVVHRAASAPPRLVRLGVGIDTEGLARFRARWNHSRIGWRASSAEATLFASKREQSLHARMRYFLRPASRLYLLPHAAATRSDLPRFETVSAELSLAPGLSWDNQSVRLEFRAGPALEYADTRRGVGPENSFFQSFKTHGEAVSHLFEYFLREPRQGFRAEFDTSSRVSRINSELTAHRIRAAGEALWNLGAYDPPLAVLGLRGWAGTTLTGDSETARRLLPPEMRFFVGGDADFRGVGPGELGDESGFLTALYLGLELRAGELLPFKLQPLVFFDSAVVGRSSARLDPDIYYAPGFGARWPTPIGAFRATLARTVLWRQDPAAARRRRPWQFFFSYGREF